MGYYVRYDLDIKPVTETDIESIKTTLAEFDLFEDIFDADEWFHDNILYFGAYDIQRWYEHEETMKKISLKYPDKVFRLECVGEDGERWLEYYQNGESEECVGRIVYAEPKTIIW